MRSTPSVAPGVRTRAKLRVGSRLSSSYRCRVSWRRSSGGLELKAKLLQCLCLSTQVLELTTMAFWSWGPQIYRGRSTRQSGEGSFKRPETFVKLYLEWFLFFFKKCRGVLWWVIIWSCWSEGLKSAFTSPCPRFLLAPTCSNCTWAPPPTT